MREIKFRVWDRYRCEMNTSDMCAVASFRDDGTVQTFGIFGDNPIMQYTGLKDKNGVEIYEGDVIEINCRTGRKGVYTDKICQVVYNTASFVAEEIPYGGVRYELHGLCEVIGNIYQNTDLFK